jgi:regulator of nucleoside diphosphate kinase
MHELRADSFMPMHTDGRPEPGAGSKTAMLRGRYPSTRPTAAQIWAANNHAPESSLPTIYMTERDHGRVADLLSTYLARDRFVSRFLADELARAVILRDEEMPDDVVTMNTRVLYRSGPEDRLQLGRLVYPEQFLAGSDHISILSPIGVALLGLGEGSLMPFTDRDGTERWVCVKRVADFSPM